MYTYLYTTTVQKRIEVVNILKNKLSDISDQITSYNINWFYVNRHNAVSQRCISEVLNDTIVVESYPFIKNLDQFIQKYFESDEKVLILIGPPGTGKTRLIRYMLKKLGQEECYRRSNESLGYYTVDSEVLKNDMMFMEFISSNAKLMVLEDIDFSLRDRKKGNTEMYKLLAMSDGLLQCADKKMVISTNAEITYIDPALTRDGRCFDVIDFRELTIDESNAFLEAVGSSQKVTKSYSLAELYKITKNNSISEPKKTKKRAGF